LEAGPTDSLDALIGPIVIIAADLVAYYLFSRLGGTTSGKGVKYQPFTGGEESIPTRGLYQSDLFVFASLFMVVGRLPCFWLARSSPLPTSIQSCSWREGAGLSH